MNPMIALGGRVPQFEPAPDPANGLMKVLQLQNAVQEADTGRLKADEYKRGVARSNRMEQILAGGGDAAALRSGGFLKEANEWEKSGAETAHKKSETVKNDADTRTKIAAQYRDGLVNVATQAQGAQWLQAQYQDPILGPVLSRFGPVESAIQAIPTDPAGFAQWKQKQGLGMAKFIELNKPSVHTQDTGAASNMVSVPGLGGAPTTLSSTPKTMTPGDSARLAQTERHFQAGQSTPQYMETDAGLVALPKKLAPGQAPTGTPVNGPDGRPLGKPLKDIPPGVNTAIITNTQSLNQLDRALKLLGGQDIGDPAAGGQRGDAKATGLKGYLPQAALNRADPQGVDARAEVADIGSLKIHDRSGAAVTISESPRLMPFIPQATDDAVTVQKKLRRLRSEIANEAALFSQTYSKEQGYKPSPVRPGGAPTGKPTVTNW